MQNEPKMPLLRAIIVEIDENEPKMPLLRAIIVEFGAKVSKKAPPSCYNCRIWWFLCDFDAKRTLLSRYNCQFCVILMQFGTLRWSMMVVYMRIWGDFDDNLVPNGVSPRGIYAI